MGSVLTVLLFFLYTWGFGFTASYFLKNADSFWERNLMRIGVGLGIFALFSILLNALRLPLDWRIFLVCSLLWPVIVLFIKRKKLKLEKTITKSDLVLLLVVLIAAISFFVYTKGAFAYPYLENEDPWGHAVGVKYVALEKNAFDPPLLHQTAKIDPVLSYIDPYPPGYDVLLGVLHQTSPNLQWTMKFFNVFIISLGFVLFYLFAKNFMGDKLKALLATFFLAAVPSYLSHFIWAHALTLTLFFPLMYALLKMKEDSRWFYVGMLLMGGIWVSQNFELPIKIATLAFIYLIVDWIVTKQFSWRGWMVPIGGIIISLLWWLPLVLHYGWKVFASYYVGGGEEVVEGAAIVAQSSGFNPLQYIQALFSAGGTGSRAYGFSDFFFAQKENMINNPIGIGWVLSILVLLGVGYSLWKYRSRLMVEQSWLAISIFWLIFTFWGVNGETFPISVTRGAFRMWMVMAIPLAIVAMEGVYFVQAFSSKKLVKIGIVGVLLLGVLLTSAYPKYVHNTSPHWPTSGSFSAGPAEAQEYAAWFSTLPLNTKVFLYSPRDKLTIGYNAFSCDWCQEILDFREVVLEKDAGELKQFLRSQDYKYLVINGRMDFKYFSGQFGEEKAKELLPLRYAEIQQAFPMVYQKGDLLAVFEVR